MKNQHKFDLVTLRAPKDDPEVGGDYYGLPWPCWGKPEIRHPGSAILYNTGLHVKEGGGAFRARFGVETERARLSLPRIPIRPVSDLTDGYPEFTFGILKKLGWDKDLRPDELATIQRIGGNNVDAVSWAIDLSGGIQRVCLEHGVMHYGNGKARANAWNLPDPVPVHREPIYSPRPDLVAKYPTRPDERQFRIPNNGFTVQKAAIDKGIAKSFPDHPLLGTSRRVRGRRRGRPGRTRGSPSCSRTCSSRSIRPMRPSAASRTADGPGCSARRTTPRRRSRRSSPSGSARVSPGCRSTLPAGTRARIIARAIPPEPDPVVLGESVNTVTTYGFDPVTGMQETKDHPVPDPGGLTEI
jgi:formate dehydrogenase major subunit